MLFGNGLDTFTEEVESLVAEEGEVQALPEVDAEDVVVPDAEEADAKAPKEPRDRTRRKVDQSNLRREIRRAEVAPEDRRCPTTGLALIETGVNVTTELHYKSAEFVLLEHHQVVYGPPPEIEKERRVEPLVAPAPAVAVEGVTASAALLAWLLCQKYVLHLPLYRQEDAFARLGVRLSRKTLCDWVMKCAFAPRRIANEIARQVRAGPVLQLDDTPIKVKRAGPGGGKPKIKQSYIWVFRNPDIRGVSFGLTEGRSTADLAALLAYGEGDDPVEVLVGDGYAANRSGAREAGMDASHGGCWAHLLRKFRDAAGEAPHAMALFMKDIAEIYAIEAKGRDNGLAPDALLELRRSEAMPIVARLMRATSGWKETYSLQGNVAKAMKYARNQRHALFQLLRDGRVPIGNNVCERAIRPIAIGRNNWMFAGSVEGAHAASTICTLVESAKLSVVDPLAYLTTVPERLGQWPSSRIGELVPWAMVEELPPFRERIVAG